nr:hypothetical protein [Bacteroidales bacterium]
MKNLIFIFVLMLALGNILSVTAGNITVTAPNGGEVWAGCTSQKITWIAEGTQNNYTIDYSTDGGKTWVSVTSSLYVTNGTYNWLIPNINSTNCLVRVIDSNNPSTLDISDKTFSITAPLLITYPDGGETLQAGSVKPITWVANGTSNI